MLRLDTQKLRAFLLRAQRKPVEGAEKCGLQPVQTFEPGFAPAAA
jgi:hypothetical protein